MPYKSKAQAAYFNIHKKELERKGVNVNEWNKSSKGKKVPSRSKSAKRKKKRQRMKEYSPSDPLRGKRDGKMLLDFKDVPQPKEPDEIRE